MGGLSCAKAVIDNGLSLNQALNDRQAAVERALGCMSTSITLSASKEIPVYPTEEMEAKFLACTAEAKRAVDAALEPVLKMAAYIAEHCDPTSH